MDAKWPDLVSETFDAISSLDHPISAPARPLRGRRHASVLSVIMTFVVSGISTLRSVGLSPGFAATWMAAWGLSWLVAFPTLLLVLPLVRRIVGLIVASPAR